MLSTAGHLLCYFWKETSAGETFTQVSLDSFAARLVKP